MTDSIKAWIEERRAEAARARNFPYVLPGSPTGRDASAARRAYNAKAGAMFPRALDALSKVLELHVPVFGSNEIDWCDSCDRTWPCATVRALEGVIDGG